MASLSQGGILKREGQVEEEELKKETEKRAEDAGKCEYGIPIVLSRTPQLRVEVSKNTRFVKDNKHRMGDVA